MKTLITMTLAAVVTASGAFASLPQDDRNNDGVLTASEFLAVYGPERGIEQFNHADKNNDQVVDASEYFAETNGGIFAGK